MIYAKQNHRFGDYTFDNRAFNGDNRLFREDGRAFGNSPNIARKMKIFKIIDEEKDLLSGVLLYYEKSRTAIIELPEYLDEWNAPLLFTGYIKKKIYTVEAKSTLQKSCIKKIED